MRRPGRQRDRDPSYPRWFWPAFTAPASVVLLVLFVVPFYAVLGVALGTLDPVFRTPIPVWNPAQWDRVAMSFTLSNLADPGGLYFDSVVRTFVFVGVATALSLCIGYPFAYFVARHAGRWRPFFLVGFFAPFLISYMMRMTAWVNLLQDNGYLNRLLRWLGVIDSPYPWLSGRPVTVILGLVYGYVPLMILPLFASLDRIPRELIDAARDLGAGPRSTFVHVTLPASKQAIVAGITLSGLSMFGDYFTNAFLAGTTGTRMLGNWIVDSLASPLQVPRGASLALLLTLLLIAPILSYLRTTRRTSRDVRA